MRNAPFPKRAFGLLPVRLAMTLVVTAISVSDAWADRSLRQQDPAYMFEKKGEYAQAALYWHRAMRGMAEVWIPVMWGEVSNAPGKWKTGYQNLVAEYRARVEKCRRLGKVTEVQRKRHEIINEIWLNELIEQEEAGFRPASGRRAEEAEKQGDFILAQVLRRYQARLFRFGAVPYHRKAAADCQKKGSIKEAALHREAAKAYATKAALAESLAAGDKVLAGMSVWGKRDRWTGIRVGQANSIVIRNAYHRRVFNANGKRHGKISSAEVTAALKKDGLQHTDENVRLSALTVLGNLGEKEAVLSALDDHSALVRRTAAKILAGTSWAEGWAACASHGDPSVRALVASILEPATGNVLMRTYDVTELMHGLASTSGSTRSFCQKALERITVQKLQGKAWSAWWKKHDDARPGLERSGPGRPATIDETVDFGAWWQSGFASIRHRPNPLVRYKLPAKVEWRGHLVVTKSGEYTFYVRNRGASIRSSSRVRTPGRFSFPAYFLPMVVELRIDGKELLPAPNAGAVEDPSAWMRIDFTKPVRLRAGLHKIHLAFNIRSYDDMKSASSRSIWGGTPCIRLYWKSDHFLREVIPARCLVATGRGEQK